MASYVYSINTRAFHIISINVQVLRVYEVSVIFREVKI